ncbi:hypothetical protein K3495_g2592 [Podosphaera aphanis]|nr:hypothetical protein K3495_g2592 [Podosphaera aphanis]
MSFPNSESSKMTPKTEKEMSSTTPVWSQPKASSNVVGNVAALQLPPYLKLKGEENYEQWKNNMENIALANNLEDYISDEIEEPPHVSIKERFAKREAFEMRKQWLAGDARMKLAIMINSASNIHGMIDGKTPALQMWTSLQERFEGRGWNLEYRAIIDWSNIRFEDFVDLNHYISEFTKRVEKISSLSESIPERWNGMFFIAGVARKFPVWAERQSSQARNTAVAPSLDYLIADLLDEARNSEISSSSASMMVKGRGKAIEGGNEVNCRYCQNGKCYEHNKSLRQDWEAKTGKKCLTRQKYLNQKNADKLKKRDDKSKGKAKEIKMMIRITTRLQDLEYLHLALSVTSH